MKVRLEFKPQDLWVGAFWTTGTQQGTLREAPGGWCALEQVDLWVCLVPWCFPLHLTWERLVPLG